MGLVYAGQKLHNQSQQVVQAHCDERHHERLIYHCEVYVLLRVLRKSIVHECELDLERQRHQPDHHHDEQHFENKVTLKRKVHVLPQQFPRLWSRAHHHLIAL